MIVTLNYRAPLGLPSGVTLEPGVPTVVHGWDHDMKSRIVQAWVKAGILQLGDGMPSRLTSDSDPEYVEVQTTGQEGSEEVPANELAADEKAELLAALEERGIKADRRTGVKKLRQMLDEAAPSPDA